MALSFPNSPSVNDIHDDSTTGFSYQWNGSIWKSYKVNTDSFGGNLDAELNLNSNDVTGTGDIDITGNLRISGIVTATSIVKSGGTSSQFLKADGSVDSSTYITSADGGNADQLDGQEGTYYLNYNNFTNTPTIPTNNNELTNGANYITSVSFDGLTGKTGGTGDYETTGDMTANNFTASSDINLKENIEVVSDANEILNQLRGVKFTWKKNNEKSVGVIAQEVENVLPELVSSREDKTKTVNYNGLIGVLIEAAKEQQKQIEELKQEIKELKGKS